MPNTIVSIQVALFSLAIFLKALPLISSCIPKLNPSNVGPMKPSVVPNTHWSKAWLQYGVLEYAKP